MQPRYQFAIASGWNVALASLTNVEALLYPYTKPRLIPPKTQPINLFPVRTVLFSGRPRGDGRVDHVWVFDVLPAAALQYLVATFYSNATVVSAQVTINTRRQELGLTTYSRYNAYAELFVPGDSMRYDRKFFRDVQWRFYKLTAAS